MLLYERNHGTFWVPVPHDAIRLFTAFFYVNESPVKIFGYYSKRHLNAVAFGKLALADQYFFCSCTYMA